MDEKEILNLNDRLLKIIKKEEAMTIDEMRYDANKKSAVTAYLLWLFVGGFGMHRFYCERRYWLVMLIGMLISIILSFFCIGVIGIIVFCIWAFIDVFFIHKWLAEYNNRLIDSIEGSD